MKLADYLNLKGISQRQFAKTIGVSYQSISNYIADPSRPNHAIPRVSIMTKIVKQTDGNVQISDFYPRLTWSDNEEFTGN